MTLSAEWLGRLPPAWSVAPLKFVARFRSGGTPDSSEDRYWTEAESGVHWIAIGDMSGRDVVQRTAKSLTPEGCSARRLSASPPGVVLLAMYASVGEVAVTAIPAVWNQAILGIIPERSYRADFLAYVLRAAKSELRSQVRSNTQDNLNAEKVGNLAVPVPPEETQQHAAEFLDHETGEIDAFIADQRRLIDLLSERRNAVVAHELSPHHGWTRLTLARLDPRQESGVSVNGSAGASAQGPDEVGVLKTGASSKGWFDPSENKLVDDEQERERVACPVRGDMALVTRANTPLLVGTAAYIEEDHPNLFLSDKLWLVDFGPWTRYLSWWMHTDMYFDQVRISASGASPSMWNLSYEDFRRFSLALPDERDRNRIVERVEAATGDIDAAIRDAREAIALSKERRAALISAAVTGQLDVSEQTQSSS